MSNKPLPVRELRSMSHKLEPCTECHGVGGSCSACGGTGARLVKLSALEPPARKESGQLPMPKRILVMKAAS